MAANPTVYCLEKLTDYSEFERLCHDLMFSEGYLFIEPLGGFKDKGRDAIHINKSNEITIFAYSVRDDWKDKLAEDSANIYKHSHTCHELVFITTSQPTIGERDKAITNIYHQYGWKLKIYALERLRLLIDMKCPEIKSRYPQIFTPVLFPDLNENKIGSEILYSKRLEAHEILFYKVKEASSIITELFDSEDLTINTKQEIAYIVGLEIAELTDKHSFYLNDELAVHVVGSFVGIENIFVIESLEARQIEIENFRRSIRTVYKMIKFVKSNENLVQSVRSPIVDYYRYLKKEQEKNDQEY